MRLRQTQVSVIVLALVLSSACAVKLKDTVVRGVETAHTLAASAQVGQIAAYQSGVSGITEAQHKQFHAGLVKYWDAEIQIMELLKTWRASDPPPVGLRAQLVIASEALQTVRGELPASTQSLTTALISAVNSMLQLVTILDEHSGAPVFRMGETQ